MKSINCNQNNLSWKSYNMHRYKNTKIEFMKISKVIKTTGNNILGRKYWQIQSILCFVYHTNSWKNTNSWKTGYSAFMNAVKIVTLKDF